MLNTKLDESINELIAINNEGWFAEYLNQHSSRFLSDLKEVISILPDKHKHIADFGAAPFATSLALIKTGYTVDSYDIAPERFQDLTSLGLTVKKIDLDNWSKETETRYDLIILTEVFEHLRGNLIKTSQNLHNSLKPGGIVYLTTPNSRSITGLYKLLFKGTSYAVSRDLYFEWNKLNTLGHMGHVREYTLKELELFFEQIGFEVITSKSIPKKLGSGFKNEVFFKIEQLFNPLRLGSGAHLILKRK